MISDKSLKKLQVAVKGGGSIVSHPPVFSPDSKNLYIIQKNSVLVHNTDTGRCIGKFITPSASSIANIVHVEDHLKVLTTSGSLLEVDPTTLEITSIRQINMGPTGWVTTVSLMDFIWPSGSSNPSHFYTLGYQEDSTLPVLFGVTYDTLMVSHLCREIVPNVHAVASGMNGQFVAAVQPDSLFAKNIERKGCRWHKAGTRKFTCVAVHPREWICATGDDSGRILIWTNSLEDHLTVAKTVFHWHTLPVADLCFSTDGTQMFSGGGECAMVKWDVNDTNNKRTLPRMGLPIRHVRGSPKNDMVAVSHADNCIQLVNSQNQIVNRIQNITQCYIPENVEDISITDTSLGGSLVFQAGLHLDPNNHSLITNGRPGHLQCYSFREDKHLYNLDISQQNFITAERNKAIPNADVSHVSFSKSGTWLATGETRRDEGKCTELRLKFWKFDREKQSFVLSTSIDWPHEVGLQCLKIQPISEDDPTLIAATSGLDKKFKTWGIVHDPSIHGKSEWWNCENVSSFRDLPAGPLSFSHDGSLLAVAFDKILTIWDSENHKLKLSLCHSKLQDDIKLVEFGSHISSHLVITSTGKSIATWDVITSSLLWVAPLQAENISIDPFSNLAAAFSSKHHLILFSLDQPDPLAVHKNVSSSRVVSSLFVPRVGQGSADLKSTLFFINSSQELCALLPPVEEVDEETILRIKPEAGRSVLTPFAQLIAENTVYENPKKVRDMTVGQTGMPGNQVIRDIMDQSPHTMPSITYYCSQLLQALSVRRTSSDNLQDIEKAVTASFKMSKPPKRGKYEKWRPLSDDEGEHTTLPDLEFLNTAKKSNIEKKRFTVDLDLVAKDDITWIQNVFTRDSD